MKSRAVSFLRSALMVFVAMAFVAPGMGLASQATTIKDLRYSSSSGYTRVVVELSGSTNFAVNRLRNPDRLYIDLRGSSMLGQGDKSINVSDGLLKAIRFGQYDSRTVRVVMDLAPGNTYKVFRLDGPPRVVVDFYKPAKGKENMPGASQGDASSAVKLARVKLKELERKKALLKARLHEQESTEAKAHAAPAHAPQSSGITERAEKTAKSPTKTPSVAVAPPVGLSDGPSWKVAQVKKKSIREPQSDANRNYSRDENTHGGSPPIAPMSQAASIERAHQARLLAEARAKALARSNANAEDSDSEPDRPTLEIRSPSHAPDKKSGFTLYKVVLDAGHGGKDPGAIGYGGIEEKDIALDIARRVKRKLEAMGGFEVHLTRNNDRFLELEDRARIANKKDADIFVSVHANASRNKRTRGLETYFLNRNSDDDTIKIAARENAIPIEEMKDVMNNLDYILASMSAQHKQEESWDLAESVQKNMYDAVARRYNGVLNKEPRKGPFYVLYGARMPSVLVEASYITNKTEAMRLKTSTYRDYIAGGIARGIGEYFKQSAAAADVAQR